MKGLFKLLSAISEKREALNKYIADTSEPDAKRVKELREALDKSEAEFRKAAAEAEAKPVESRHPVHRAELRGYMHAALRGDRFVGAEAEANKEMKLDDQTQVPWEAFMPREPEERADTATSVPAAAIGHPQQAVLPRIFQRSRTSFLGMRMPMVSSGEPVYPVLTGGTSGEAKSAGDAVEADAATFTAVMVAPTRLSARYIWRMEDVARFPVEDALRSDMRMVMNDLLDEQVLNGNGTAPNMNGLLRNHAAGPLGAAATEATTTDFNQVLTKHYNYVDGKAAGMVSDVRTLMGVETYVFLATLFQGASGEQLYSLLSRLGIRTAVWAGVPAKGTAGSAANVQQAIQTRRPGDAVVPVWQGVTMIRDPYTGAAKAEVALTAHMLANFKLLRSDNWRKVGFKLA